MHLTLEQQLLSFYLPDNTLDYFDILSSQRSPTELCVTLEEKNNPPLEARHRGLTIESKGFKEISIIDFPIRGRRTILTFRRRRWQVGDELLKRDIPLRSPGTQLEKEFGDFLKETG